MEQFKRDFKGIWIPKEIWLNEELSLLEKCVLVEINSLDGEEGCFASNKYLAELCKCSESAIDKAVKKLKELGLIYVKSFDGRVRVLKSCIQRGEKNKNYTVMSNHHLRDSLTLKAKGLLSLMLSLPDDWDCSIEGLIAICVENETAIRSALKELMEHGYLIRKKYMPNKTASGRIEYEYIVSESPYQRSGKEEEERNEGR